MANDKVEEAFAKALDYVNAQVTPKDGGAVAAAVEVLRKAFYSNPEFAARLKADFNDKIGK